MLQVDTQPEEQAPIIPASEGAYGSVVRLNEQIFRGNVLREEDDRVVHWMVYWCPEWWEPCQRMSHTYKKLAIQWQEDLNEGALFGLQVRFARVDCATDKVLCNAMSVNDYPMVQHYSRGQRVASWSDRSNLQAKRLAQWLERELGEVPASEEVPSMVTTIASRVHAAFWQEYAMEVALVLTILAMNCWGVMRSPLLKHGARQLSSSVRPRDETAATCEDSDCSEQKTSGVERVLPEEWLCQRQSVGSLDL